MRRVLVHIPLAALALVGSVSAAHAQPTVKAQGSIVSMAADSLTVKVGSTDLKFAVDDKTTVEAVGGSTAQRAAARSGQAGPKLSEVLKVGDAVEVNYHDGATKHAVSIRKVSSPGSGGAPPKSADGTVTAVSASSLSIEGSGGGGSKFTATYTIDDKTKVVGRGAGTASAAAGGKVAATTVIGKGDRVNVSFEEAGTTLRATEIRVTQKAAPK